MKLYWSACAIVIGVIGAAPFIDASSYKDNQREPKLTGEGVFMRTKMLRNQRSLSDQSRIVGGNDADIGKYPFFVEWEGCGASLVHKDIIVSAAHCAEISSNTVYVGSSRKFALDFAGGRGLQRSITTRISHPSYTSGAVDYDYLVMKLNSPVEDIKPALLNEDTNVPIEAELLTVVGYGTTAEGGDMVSTLQEVGVNYITTEQCNINYSGAINGVTMMCAGTGGGKDSCQGDSGGPLVIQDGDTYTQVGIVSWGNGCAQPDFPGVYSRVSGQIEWIKTQICNLSDDPPDYCNEGSMGPVAATAPPISSPTFAGSTDAPVSAAPVLPTSASPLPVPTSPTAPVAPPTAPSAPTSTVSPPTAPSAPTATVSPPTPPTTPSAPTATVSPPTAPSAPTTTVSPPTVPSSSPLSVPSAPISSEECTDSGETFPVDDILENRDCTWLAENMMMFGYLCRFLDVAATCKKTCDVCQYFYP